MHEFDIIEKFFNRHRKNHSAISLGIGDDAALIIPPAGQELATSVDCLNAGIHFPDPSAPQDLGYKSLAVSLSDLAAMGAQPAAVLLSLTLPENNPAWLESFSQGFFELADQHQVELIGGNISRGPLSITTVTYGWVPAGKALKRSGAQVDDDIYVSGQLGGAAFALQKLLRHQNISPELHQRFYRPQPRIKAGLALRDIATAAIDLSDGLGSDLEKLLNCNSHGGKIYLEHLPLFPALNSECSQDQALELALNGGEDYELCFSAPQIQRRQIGLIAAELDCRLSRIGCVTSTKGLDLIGFNHQPAHFKIQGFQHF